MAPKLEAARTAVTGGARAAWIATWAGAETLPRLLAGTGGGTRIALAATLEEIVRG
jgi:acetylglutamate kinase